MIFLDVYYTNAFSRLEGIKDPKAVGPDGQTIEDRMKELVEKTAEDIKRCAGGALFAPLRCLVAHRHSMK